MRQFLFDAWHSIYLGRLLKSSEKRVADIAEKASKEVAYHLERSADTVVALGDGTEESHRRMEEALAYLWPYVARCSPATRWMPRWSSRDRPRSGQPAREYDALVGRILSDATLEMPEGRFAHKGGRDGRMHTEHLVTS